jgi:hypothetical protein
LRILIICWLKVPYQRYLATDGTPAAAFGKGHLLLWRSEGDGGRNTAAGPDGIGSPYGHPWKPGGPTYCARPLEAEASVGLAAGADTTAGTVGGTGGRCGAPAILDDELEPETTDTNERRKAIGGDCDVEKMKARLT